MGLLRRERLDPTVLDDLRRTCGTAVRPLAWGQDEGLWAVGTTTELLVGAPGEWDRCSWHRIARGGWNGPEQLLKWTTYDGDRHEIRLTRPGQLPELFNERVQSTIVVEQRIRIPGHNDEGIVIAGRRAPSSDQVDWHVSLLQGTTWQTPGARETAEVMVERLRMEFEHG